MVFKSELQKVFGALIEQLLGVVETSALETYTHVLSMDEKMCGH